MAQAGTRSRPPAPPPTSIPADTASAAASTPGYVLVSAHGGAGATTLTRLLDPERTGLIIDWRPGMAAPFERVPLLVARSTAAGLRAAAEFVVRWKPSLVRPTLLVVADAPFRYPPVVRFRLRSLSSQVTAVIEVPYLYPLRYLDDPAEALGQRKVAAAVRSLREQLSQLPVPDPAQIPGGL